MQRGVPADRLTTIENWAPLDQLPQRERDNPWATRHELVDRFVYLYAGTLGIKHQPEALVELAATLARQDPDARLVVVAEGSGASWLAHELDSLIDRGLVLLLPFQDFDELPDVLASADVLLALLDPAAQAASVPSKVLSYLCAGRPIVGMMPAENAASVTIVEKADAGLVNDDVELFVKSALRLRADAELRQRLGANGRSWAEANFDLAKIADRFEVVLQSLLPAEIQTLDAFRRGKKREQGGSCCEHS